MVFAHRRGLEKGVLSARIRHKLKQLPELEENLLIWRCSSSNMELLHGEYQQIITKQKYYNTVKGHLVITCHTRDPKYAIFKSAAVFPSNPAQEVGITFCHQAVKLPKLYLFIMATSW